MVNKDSHW